MADDDDLNPHEWEKPAWAKEGPKLRSTGKGAPQQRVYKEQRRESLLFVFPSRYSLDSHYHFECSCITVFSRNNENKGQSCR